MQFEDNMVSLINITSAQNKCTTQSNYLESIFIEKGAKDPHSIYENIQEMWFRKNI